MIKLKDNCNLKSINLRNNPKLKPNKYKLKPTLLNLYNSLNKINIEKFTINCKTLIK